MKKSFILKPLSVNELKTRTEINGAINMNPKAIFINGTGHIYKFKEDALNAVDKKHTVYMIPRFIRVMKPTFLMRLKKVFKP